MPSPSPYDALLAQSRDLLCEGLCAALSAMFDKANNSIAEVLEKADDQELKKLLLEARDVAASQRPMIEKQFRERYFTEFRKTTNRAKKISPSFSDMSMGELTLVDDDDLDETLKFNGVTAKFRKVCEEEISALDQRVRVLLEDPGVESDDNPFGAQVICDAYKHACRQTGAGVQVRLILLRLFDETVPAGSRSAYQSVNDLLVANSILPKIKYGITKNENSKRPPPADKAAGEKEAAGEKAAEPPEDEADIFSKIQKMLAPFAAASGPPAPGMGVGGVPIMQGADLLGSLTKIQTGDLSGVTGQDGVDLASVFAAASNMTNVLKKLKTSNVGASMGQVDAMTLDIVSMLFDALFDDPKVPIALKGIIGRLQLPMLKVALADKDLFTKKTHPARQLLDALGQIGFRLPPDFDDTSPLFGKLEGFIEQIVDGFEEKTDIFDAVREHLEEIISEYDHRVVAETEAATKQLQQAETLAIAKAAAQDEITSRVQSAPHAPRVVVEFLAQHWIKYLLIVHARDGHESDAWKSALETIDDILWSIEPKPTMEERRKLAGSIPRILKGVRAGVAAAGIEPEAGTAFFGELMKCHTEVMQAPPKVKEPPPSKSKSGAAVTKKAPPPPPPPVTSDLLDFSTPVVVDNPFGEGKIEVASEDLDFTATMPPTSAIQLAPDAAAPSSGASAAGSAPRAKRTRDTTIPLPARMVEGAWVEIAEKDESRTVAKLHFVSPMKSHFLFTDRNGNKVYECSRSKLARRIDDLEVVLLPGEPDASLFDRILTTIFGKLGAPAPA